MFHSFQNVLLMNVWEVWLRFDLEQRLTAQYIISFVHLETQILLCKRIRVKRTANKGTLQFSNFYFSSNVEKNLIFILM